MAVSLYEREEKGFRYIPLTPSVKKFPFIATKKDSFTHKHESIKERLFSHRLILKLQKKDLSRLGIQKLGSLLRSNNASIYHEEREELVKMGSPLETNNFYPNKKGALPVSSEAPWEND